MKMFEMGKSICILSIFAAFLAHQEEFKITLDESNLSKQTLFIKNDRFVLEEPVQISSACEFQIRPKLTSNENESRILLSGLNRGVGIDTVVSSQKIPMPQIVKLAGVSKANKLRIKSLEAETKQRFTACDRVVLDVKMTSIGEKDFTFEITATFELKNFFYQSGRSEMWTFDENGLSLDRICSDWARIGM